jgi:hypothetical protein
MISTGETILKTDAQGRVRTPADRWEHLLDRVFSTETEVLAKAEPRDVHNLDVM